VARVGAGHDQQMPADLTPAAAGHAARDAQQSPTFALLARLGIASRGVVWLVVGLLALSVLLGGGDRQTDRQGALREISGRPFGTVLLVVLVVGFLSYAAWRALSAAVGHREVDDDRKRLGKRAMSGAKAVLYAALAASTLRFLLQGDSGGDRTPGITADVMARSGGRWLIGAVGVAVIATGIVMIVRAVRGKHVKKLEQQKVPSELLSSAKTVGTVGLSGRGLVLALIGAFLLQAAVTYDAAKARGLDAALQTLAGQAYGKALLAVAVIGVLAYAVWSFVEAAYRKL
jgi:hypothetical protein